jgi:hypothetical protein
MGAIVQIMDKVLFVVNESYHEVAELVDQGNRSGDPFIELHDHISDHPLTVNTWQMSYFRPDIRGE